MAFITLAFTQLFHSYNVKSDLSVFTKQAFNNKFLNLAFIAGAVMQLAVVYIPGVNMVFESVALEISQLAISIGCAFGIVIVMEAYKLISKLIKK